MAVSGGDKLAAALRAIATKLSRADLVNVGFLEGSTYPDGTSIPMVAAIQEFGATINRAASQQTIYRKVNKDGSFAKNGKFVKRKASNFATTHDVGPHTIVIPPRPYFRQMIAKQSPNWGKELAKLLKAQNYDSAKSLKTMGTVIKEQLQQSIGDLSSPPLADSTVARKGFAKPLIDTGAMQSSVDYEVK